MLSFGKNIKALRQQKNKTLREVAAFLNISVKFLDKIENGWVNATKTQVFHLASCLEGDEQKMLATYLGNQVSQVDQPGRSSKRLQKISQELNQLHTRQLQARVHKPMSPINSYIKNAIYYCGDNKMHPYERTFPDGTVRLVIELDGNQRFLVAENRICSPASLTKAWVEGVQEKPSTYRLRHSEKTLIIQFTPGGFYALTGIPVTEITDSFIDAELLFDSTILSLREQLLACGDADSLFGVTEKYFSEKISAPKDKASIVEHIVNNIHAPLSELVANTGYSHKYVIHCFKKYIGISPKYFQRIFRFNRTLTDIISKTQKVDCSDIVFANGYYDQSHFIKEFNHFAGMNPEAYLETGSTCTKFLHLSEIR